MFQETSARQVLLATPMRKRPQRSSKEEVEWLHHRPCFVLFCYWTRRNFWDCCSPWFWLIVSYNSANKQKQYKNPPRKELSFEIRINENSYNGKRTDRCKQRVYDTGLVKEHGGLVKQPREVFRFVLRLLSPDLPNEKRARKYWTLFWFTRQSSLLSKPMSLCL